MVEIRPALTAEEWAEGNWDIRNHPEEVLGEPYGWKPDEHAHVWTNIGRAIVYVGDGGRRREVMSVARIKGGGERRAVAALCLDGQPYGFTREDVRRHRAAAKRYRTQGMDLDMQLQQGAMGMASLQAARLRCSEEARWHESMAERIAALLPPEGLTETGG